MKKSIKTILKDKKGMSLVLVLCVILLLLGISTSILVAASSSVGADNDQWNYDQLKMHADSVTKMVMYSLQNDDSADKNNPNSLGGKLVKKIYTIKRAEYDAQKDGNAKKQDAVYPKSFVLNLDEELPNTTISTFTLNFTSVSMNFQEPMPTIPPIVDDKGHIIEEGVPRIYERADIEATMQVEFSITFKDKEMRTLLTFKLTGAYLDDFDGTDIPTQSLTIKNLGKWRMISSEKVNV